MYTDYAPTKKPKPPPKKLIPKVVPIEEPAEEPPIDYAELNENLVHAIINEDIWSISKIIEGGADPNFSDSNEYRPIHFAVSKRQEDPLAILKALNYFHPDFNAITQEGDTVLTLALKKIENEEVCYKVVEYLKKANVPYALKDQDGYDAFTLAKMRNFKTILPLFTESYKKYKNQKQEKKQEVKATENIVAPSFGVQSTEKPVKTDKGFCTII